jgi:hypothetical protein
VYEGYVDQFMLSTKESGNESHKLEKDDRGCGGDCGAVACHRPG